MRTNINVTSSFICLAMNQGSGCSWKNRFSHKYRSSLKGMQTHKRQKWKIFDFRPKLARNNFVRSQSFPMQSILRKEGENNLKTHWLSHSEWLTAQTPCSGLIVADNLVKWQLTATKKLAYNWRLVKVYSHDITNNSRLCS